MLSVPALNSDDAKKCPLCHAGEWIFLFPFLLGFMLTLGFSRVWSPHFIVLQTVVNSSSAWNCLDLFSGQVNSPWPTSEPKYIPRRFPHRRSDPKTEWHCNGFKVSAQYNGVPVGAGKATKPSFLFQSWALYWGNSQQIFFHPPVNYLHWTMSTIALLVFVVWSEASPCFLRMCLLGFNAHAWNLVCRLQAIAEMICIHALPLVLLKEKWDLCWGLFGLETERTDIASWSKNTTFKTWDKNGMN